MKTSLVNTTGAPDRAEFFHFELGKLFGTSLLITGTVERAESALLETIDLLSDRGAGAGDFSHNFLALACARSSVAVVRRAKPASDSEAESASLLLPKELGTVLRLAPDLRCCFVLRILMGYTVAQTGQLMDGLSSREVQSLTQAALLRLSQLAYERRPRSGLQARSVNNARADRPCKKVAGASTT
jgi:hypothetical protein